MDTAIRSVAHRPEHVTATAALPAETVTAARTLTVSAAYLLSETGRKASLLSGGNGRAVQQIQVHVPVNRLHLVNVSGKGVARLKLRPRFERDGEDTVVRIDAPPTYDSPPTIEDLFREAARNHELERSYHAERKTFRSSRRRDGSEWRSQVAAAFLQDPTQRALAHASPSPRRCSLSGFVASDSVDDWDTSAWRGPTMEGLIAALEEAVRNEPEPFLELLGQFLAAKRRFQHALIWGLKQAWDAPGKHLTFDWNR